MQGYLLTASSSVSQSHRLLQTNHSSSHSASGKTALPTHNMICYLLALFLCSTTVTTAYTPSSSVSRKAFLQTAVATGFVLPQQQVAWADTTLPNGVSYKVVKEGSGAKPTIGDLVAVRFAAYAGDVKIDDIFETPEPYYTRLGSGGLIKGVEETLPLMQLGDRWVLTIPVRFASLHLGYCCRSLLPTHAFVWFVYSLTGKIGFWIERTSGFGGKAPHSSGYYDCF